MRLLFCFILLLKFDFLFSQEYSKKIEERKAYNIQIILNSKNIIDGKLLSVRDSEIVVAQSYDSIKKDYSKIINLIKKDSIKKIRIIGNYNALFYPILAGFGTGVAINVLYTRSVNNSEFEFYSSLIGGGLGLIYGLFKSSADNVLLMNPKDDYQELKNYAAFTTTEPDFLKSIKNNQINDEISGLTNSNNRSGFDFKLGLSFSKITINGLDRVINYYEEMWPHGNTSHNYISNPILQMGLEVNILNDFSISLDGGFSLFSENTKFYPLNLNLNYNFLKSESYTAYFSAGVGHYYTKFYKKYDNTSYDKSSKSVQVLGSISLDSEKFGLNFGTGIKFIMSDDFFLNHI